MTSYMQAQKMDTEEGEGGAGKMGVIVMIAVPLMCAFSEPWTHVHVWVSQACFVSRWSPVSTPCTPPTPLPA